MCQNCLCYEGKEEEEENVTSNVTFYSDLKQKHFFIIFALYHNSYML